MNKKEGPEELLNESSDGKQMVRELLIRLWKHQKETERAEVVYGLGRSVHDRRNGKCARDSAGDGSNCGLADSQ